MAAGVGAPNYGVEIANFSDLVQGQTYKIVKGWDTDHPKITQERFVDSNPDNSYTLAPRFLYKFRRMGSALPITTVTYPGDRSVKVYPNSTGGARRPKRTQRQHRRRTTTHRRRAHRK